MAMLVDRDELVRGRALDALVARSSSLAGEAEVIEALCSQVELATTRNKEPLRVASFEALGSLYGPSTVPLLCALLVPRRYPQGQGDRLRRGALLCLRHLEDPASIPAIDAMVKEPDVPKGLRDMAIEVANHLRSGGAASKPR